MYIYRITAIAFIAVLRFWLGLAGLFALCFFANFIFFSTFLKFFRRKIWWFQK
jgi:hypothetical protein